MTDNELIAEFMGFPAWENRVEISPPHESYKALRKMQYHTSWDWLMPVVEKIKQLYNDEYDLNKCIPMLEQTIFKCGIMSPQKVVYASVVDFIKWYNQTKKL